MYKNHSFIKLYEKQYPDSEGINRLKGLLDKILNFIPEIYKWAVIRNYSAVQGPVKDKAGIYLKEIVRDLQTICSSSIDRFEEIGKNLQIGEDRKALNDLYYLMELMDEVILVLRITGEIYKVDLETQNESCNFIETKRLIQELMQAVLRRIDSLYRNLELKKTYCGDPLIKRFLRKTLISSIRKYSIIMKAKTFLLEIYM